MGNESSSFKDCTFEGEIPTSTRECWTLHQASAKDSTKVSVFVYSEQNNDSYIENAAKYLKVLRHPNIVKYLALHHEADESWLITERVAPLEVVIDKLSAPEICAGLFAIAEALAFLHEKGEVCHNNIGLSSIFVGSDGSWLLGGLDFTCKFNEATSTYLAQCKVRRTESAIAPEEKGGRLSPSPELGHARDAFAFGMLADALLERLSDLGDLTKTFELRIQDEFLNPDPKERPLISTVLQDRLFKNDYLEIINFLKNVTLKTNEEKKTFFWDLARKLHQLPVGVVASRLVHPLLSRFVLLDTTACDCLVPHLLTPFRGTERTGLYKPGELNPILPEPLFKKHVISELFKIFHVRDAHIRCVLLTHFHHYFDLFDSQILRNSILPQILLGLRDTDDRLVSLSLHAVAHMVPMLGGEIVIGAHRSRIFSQSTPKFGAQSVMKGRSPDHKECTPEKRSTQNGPSLTIRQGEKRTLKDMAKDAERQKRREEAKKRAEDRRKRREERKQNPLPAKIVSVEEPVEETGSPAEDHTEDIQPTEEHEDPEWSGLDETAQNDQSEERCSSSVQENHAPQNDATESDIDREIEDEISAMDSPEQADREPLEPVEPGPPVHVDWSDAMQTKPGTFQSPSPLAGQRGALKLKGPKVKTHTSPPPKSTVENKSGTLPRNFDFVPGNLTSVAGTTGSSIDDSWDDGGWDNQESVSDNWGIKDDSWIDVPDLKHSRQSSDGSQEVSSKRSSVSSQDSKSSTTSKSRNSPARISKKMDKIDIFNMDIKTSVHIPVQDPELDLFADMAPVISTQNNNLMSMLRVDGVTETSSQKAKPQTVAFAMMDTEGDEAGAWGEEDLDWGVEDQR